MNFEDGGNDFKIWGEGVVVICVVEICFGYLLVIVAFSLNRVFYLLVILFVGSVR